jgi:hypothetical protein
MHLQTAVRLGSPSMSASAQTRFPGTLPAPWLAVRLGVDPVRIDAMRRAGELIAVRDAGSTEWLYPAWQFEGDRPRRDIARISAEARDSGLDETQLYELLTKPMGLGGGRRRSLVDLLDEGRTDEIVASIRAAR